MIENGGLVIAEPQNGLWVLRVDASKVKNYPPGSYVYDVLQISPTDSRVWRRQRSTMTLDKGITF
jgi:hypothetical protein